MVDAVQYDVALSFAGEDRELVSAIADCLRGRGVRVFYDEYEKTQLWGKDLQEHLMNVYFKWSKYAVMFVSRAYSAKVWTRHERRAILARALEGGSEYVLPIRLDDTKLEGLLPTVHYLDAQDETAATLCVHICTKLGISQKNWKANQVASPWSKSVHDTVTFPYRSHDGKFRIGDDPYLFETRWSNGGPTSIHCYNDPPSIRGIALAPRGAAVTDIIDASAYDYTSGSQTAAVGQVVVMENDHGFFAAVKVEKISGEPGAEYLTMTYYILRDGSADFSAVMDESGLTA